MMTDSSPGVDEASRQVEAALQGQAPALTAEGAFVTSWVLVSDWLMPDGKRLLHVLTPEGLTDWGQVGLLQGALDMEDEEESE